jgi:hypothetical protein
LERARPIGSLDGLVHFQVSSLITEQNMGHEQTVAVIGAGIAGLACARRLQRSEIKVTIFEKSRGVGGRVATRRTDSGASFDHGAQYFTARDQNFTAQVQEWCAEGTAAIWDGRVVDLREGLAVDPGRKDERYVGVPAMNAIAKSLAKTLDVRVNTAIQSVCRLEDKWHLTDSGGTGHGPYDTLISTAPPEQTRVLFGEHASALLVAMTRATMEPCWAVMLELHQPMNLAFDAAFVRDSPLSWVARNSSKPQRAGPECWVLHASASWSRENLETPAGNIAATLTEQLWQSTRHPPLPVAAAITHRWRYARPLDPLAERYLLDRRANLGACGDWCGGARVEGAYLSGLAMAEALLQKN